ncbi:gustatory receptor 68a-like [Schistocerca gregaria]|uniref:gustatory receptor 68a-like n=1 Tax=Schistocerca gregaria TaxID=7010 RepID=UPI00211E158C|nr:gustatory receptor 68a-like [Schistocerca gregaria]
MQLADTHIPTKKVKYGKVLGLLVIAVNISMLLYLVTVSLSIFANAFVSLVVILVILFDVTITLQFILLVLEMWARFSRLNAALQDALYPHCTELFVGASPSYRCSLLQLQKTYVALGRAADHLMSHFGLPVAFDIAFCICGATCSSYEVLVKLLSDSKMLGLSIEIPVSVSEVWLALHWLRILLFSLSCAAAEDTAASTGVILIRASVVPQRRTAEFDEFLRFTLQGPRTSFSAAGFVKIDRRLIVSALTAVITYLIILGQLTFN